MVKTIFKELAILILLIIAIGLIFVIVFYDYTTINTTVPSRVEAYKLSDGVKEELNETLNVRDSQELIKTYIVDESDLRIYEATNDYEKGKPNPFSTYVEETKTDDTEGETNATSSNSATTGGDTGKLSSGVNGK